MEQNHKLILGLAVINLAIVYYELRGARGWRPYFATLGILIIATIFPPLALLVFIPLTALNLLFNTTRIRNVKREE